MNIIIRKWSASDYDGISDIFLQVHELHQENRPDIYVNTDNPFMKEHFLQILNDENAIAFLAEANGKIVGFSLVTLKPPSKNPVLMPRKVAYMEDLAVDRNFRKKGVGKRLFDAVKVEAFNRGYGKLELMVWSFNESAKRFYQELGMSERSVIMEMDLSSGGLK